MCATSAQNIVSILQMVVLTFLAPLSHSIMNVPRTNGHCKPQKTTLKGTWPHGIMAVWWHTHANSFPIKAYAYFFFPPLFCESKEKSSPVCYTQFNQIFMSWV